jgi:hypothetical protein
MVKSLDCLFVLVIRTFLVIDSQFYVFSCLVNHLL